MGVIGEVVPTSEKELIDLAACTYGTILRSSREILRLKFELGRLVTMHLQRHAREHAAVARMAQAISEVCGKVIVPQRLYEAARYYETFGGNLEYVWEFERRMSHPVTYTYLIRNIIPRVHKGNAWNPEEWSLYQDAQIGRLECAVQEIESLQEERVRAVALSDGEIVSERPVGTVDLELEKEAPSQADGLLTMCCESQEYQEFRAATFVSKIVQSFQQLEGMSELLSGEDRQRLREVCPILRRLVEYPVQSAA